MNSFVKILGLRTRLFPIISSLAIGVGTAELMRPSVAISQIQFFEAQSVFGDNGNLGTTSAAFTDIDADGLPDLFLLHLTGAQVYRNMGGTQLQLVGSPPELPNDKSLQVGIWADYDNDGDHDLFVAGEAGFGGPALRCYLFRNDGGFSFADVSSSSGIADVVARGFSAAWLDYDLDGFLDLFIGTVHESRPVLLRNQGNGTFSNQTGSAGLSSFFTDTRGIATGDYDNDGDTDVFLANTGSTPNYLFRNDQGSFQEVALTQGVALSFDNAHSAEFADVDNDGDLDLFVGNDGAPMRLFRNVGGTFEDVAVSAGLSAELAKVRGSAFADFDNDGDLDLLVATNQPVGRKIIMRNDGTGAFSLPSQAGLDSVLFGQTLAIADYNNDGKQDLFIGDRNQRDLLFENESTAGNWLKLALSGSLSNRAAVGARIELVVGNATQIREVTAGYGYRSQNSFVQHFGTGGATSIDSVKIYWPSRTNQLITNVAVNQNLAVIEPPPGHQTELSGPLRGLLSKEFSPYLVTGDISVDPGTELVIEPGVQISFSADAKFEIFGKMTAVGSAADSILFTNDIGAPAEKWRGIRFMGATGESALKFCVIENGEADPNSPLEIDRLASGVYVMNSEVDIENCAIRGQKSEQGAAIYARGFAGRIAQNSIRENTATNGAVLHFTESANPVLSQNLIEDNNGGGVWISNLTGTAQIDENAIARNLSGIRGHGPGTFDINANRITSNAGAGIHYYSGGGTSVRITRNIIANNNGTGEGGGISLEGVGGQIIHNTIDGNSSVSKAGGIDLNTGFAVVVQSNIVTNSQSGPGLACSGGSQSHDISYNNIWNNAGGDISNCAVLSENITADPKFTGGQPFSYTLQSDSPCIDSGHPGNDPDPDGSRPDIGALPFDQSATNPFTEISVGFSDVAWGSTSWGDYDGDGDFDLLLTGNSNSTYVAKIYNNQSGVFTDIAAGLVGVWESSTQWGDFDNDGDLDILLAGNANRENENRNPVSIVYRNDNGQFSAITASLAGVFRCTARWADLDNDGDLDLLLAGERREGSISIIYENQSGNFGTVIQELESSPYSTAAFGDFDKDLDTDLLLSGGSFSGAKLLRNVGGALTEIESLLTGAGVPSAAWGDYDADGDLDLVVAGAMPGGAQRTQIFQNVGTSLLDIQADVANLNYGATEWADFDNDGDFDLLLTGSSSSGYETRLYENASPNAFASVTDTLVGAYTSSAAWADYDNDSDLDFVLTGSTTMAGTITKLYRNNSGTPNRPPSPPNNLNSFVAQGDVNFTWQAGSDNETPSPGLTYNLRVGTTPGGVEIVSPMANPITGARYVPEIGNANSNLGWRLDGLPEGEYYWSVQSIDNAFAGSPFAAEKTFRIGPVTDAVPPASPRFTKATAGEMRVRLEWLPSSEPDFLRYRIYARTAPVQPVQVDSVEGAGNTTKTLTDLVPNATYYFRITAVDSSQNESVFSNELSATPLPPNTAPAPPQNLQAAAGTESVTLSWSTNPEGDVLRYRIYGATTPSPLAVMDSVDADQQPSLMLSGLPGGVTHYFRITAVDTGFLESGFSPEVSATPIAADAPPAPPQDLQAQAGLTEVTITWSQNPEPDILRYRIYGGPTPDPTSRIDSVAAGAGTARTIKNLNTNTTYYFRLTAVDNALQESGFSASISVTTDIDASPPTVAQATYSSVSQPNQDLTISVQINDESGLRDATLYFREGGRADFGSAPMMLNSNAAYEGTIPGAVLSSRGAEFYVAATDSFGNVTNSIRYPVHVKLGNGLTKADAQTAGTTAAAYRLFSVPLDLDDKSATNFVARIAALSAAEPGTWRWYAFDRPTGTLRQYPEFSGISMKPGEGFALIVSFDGVRLESGSGTTLPTTEPFEMAMPAGWSLLGNPFDFAIPYDSLSTSSGSFEIWSLEGEWRPTSGSLQPWTGYAIWMSEAATFSIRAGLEGTSAPRPKSSGNHGDRWLLRISASTESDVNSWNFIGQDPAASDQIDAQDRHAPMRFGGQLGVYFESGQLDETAVRLKTDMRQVDKAGQVWNLVCEPPDGDKVLELMFDELDPLPAGLHIRVMDAKSRLSFDMSNVNRALPISVNGRPRLEFYIAAGTPAFLESEFSDSFEHAAGTLSLSNYPNPFNPVTQIVFNLTEPGPVRLRVYDIRGRVAATLVEEYLGAGQRTAVWDASSNGSGLYVLELNTGGRTIRKKCLVVK